VVNYVEVTEQRTRAFTQAANAPGVLSLPVLSCPGWTVADLVEHLGKVQIWWTWVLRGNGEKPPRDQLKPLQTPSPDLLTWWQEHSEDFLATLRTTPADTETWCWWNTKELDTANAVAWRQMHEVVIHLWDLETAVSTPSPITAEIAADGINEFIARMLPVTAQEALQLQASDINRTWTLAPNLDQPATTTITASAEQLDLLLWRRIPLDNLTITGDPALATAFLTWADLN
jgi:uncharacterized protein (TIGR03083 family)